jgi:activator of HSP90 ATPase
MTPTILQRVKFAASPKVLFEIYMDSAKHAMATGAPAKVSRKAGGPFSAFGGSVVGTNLLMIRDRLIVQAWRAAHWKKSDISILVMEFSKVSGGAQAEIVHAGVPAHDHKAVSQGWPHYYWKPWKKYLRMQKRKR